MNKGKHVLIVGGGISGLALALFLKKANIHSTIFEKRDSNSEQGAGFFLFPNGVRVLKELISEQELLENSIIVESLHLFNKENKELSVKYENHYNNIPLVNISRHHLLRLLLKKAVDLGIRINYDKTLDRISQSSKGVTAHFEDGTYEECDLLIGADGTFSQTRAQIFSDFNLDYGGMWGVQGISSLDFDIENRGYAYNDEHFMMTYNKCHPVDSKNILWQAFGFSPKKLPVKDFELATVEGLRTLIKNSMQNWNVPNHIRTMVDNTDKIFARTIFNLENLPSWSKNRVALVGDAIHTANPFLGQGASFGLEDAMYLAKMLKEHDYRDAFFFYEDERRPRVKQIKDYFTSVLENDTNNIEKIIEEYEIIWDDDLIVENK
ncbi:NAD(P)/FAD-dependent oxidoreductase [Priestia filamentosa]|uniref:FAD-dependent oxidoreductase n=1 Tax=Priestia filamentosa TaxID=1402861 RepID=UPI0039832106